MGMVNDAVTADPERALALSYAPAASREAVETLFALDARLRHIALVARDPTIGLMRLTWWGEALEALDERPAPAEPLLRALAATVLLRGVTGVALVGLVDGWARLLEGEPDVAAYAAERGGWLFTLAAILLGGEHPATAVTGEGWALVDLAHDRPDLSAPTLAEARLTGLLDLKWPRTLRPLGALGLLARFDLAGSAVPGSARRVGRLLLHRLTGR